MPARLTVDQYHRLLEARILRDGEPIELLDGVLVLKDRSARGEGAMTIGKRHAAAVRLLLDLAAVLTARGLTIQVQLPITIPPHDEPEPDGAILRGSSRDYLDRHPGPSDVPCVIEVSDSSLAEDRTVKLNSYAAAGIPIYLIVNLVDSQIEVYRDARASTATYARTDVYRRGQVVALELGSAFPLEVPVDSLLP